MYLTIDLPIYVYVCVGGMCVYMYTVMHACSYESEMLRALTSFKECSSTS